MPKPAGQVTALGSMWQPPELTSIPLFRIIPTPLIKVWAMTLAPVLPWLHLMWQVWRALFGQPALVLQTLVSGPKLKTVPTLSPAPALTGDTAASMPINR